MWLSCLSRATTPPLPAFLNLHGSKTYLSNTTWSKIIFNDICFLRILVAAGSCVMIGWYVSRTLCEVSLVFQKSNLLDPINWDLSIQVEYFSCYFLGWLRERYEAVPLSLWLPYYFATYDSSNVSLIVPCWEKTRYSGTVRKRFFSEP